MSKTIAHRELRNRSAEILRQVQSGESFVVTNHGEAVALLSPVESGLAPRIQRARVAGGFSSLHRVRIEEPLQAVLDALRDER